MQIFGAVILFLMVVLAVIFLTVLYYIRKGFIRFRQHLTGDYDEETFKRMSDKYYRGNGSGPQFDKDYFKGAGSNRQYHRPNPQQQRSQQQTRQATTHEGMTIIDERSREERKKIFADNEGEYVEFTEE